MASINDLKTTTAYTGTGVSNEEVMHLGNPNTAGAADPSAE